MSLMTFQTFLTPSLLLHTRIIGILHPQYLVPKLQEFGALNWLRHKIIGNIKHCWNYLRNSWYVLGVN